MTKAKTHCAVRTPLTGGRSAFHPQVGVSGTVKSLIYTCLVLHASLLTSGAWMLRFVRFGCFIVLMLPGFIPPILSYIWSPRIVKHIVYGPLFRQQLDVYLCGSEKAGQPGAPVVIFVCGGAWIIGYKMWGFIMGQLFQEHRVCFVSLDYRNFPQATVDSMVQDVILGVQWVFDNIEEIGGDPNNVSLVGQSAGAHLSALAVLERSKAELCGSIGAVKGKPSPLLWSTSCASARGRT